ncbi:hypothetical protein I3760_02G152100 [Carya illinoinensis]|nr:hypothetical protein I3760_02G152100 [Carya illinoinensis]KAG2722987.1 hypothetical protein I3760_02G152100 [Carya illinoinensis]
MATAGEEEVEYESDPEEVKRSLAMRRREASDDEEGEGEGREKPRVDRRVVTHSDESDGQGGVAEYEDDEELDEEEEQEDEEDEEGEVELDGDAGEEEEELYGDGRIEGETRVGSGVDSAVSRLNVNEAHGDERRSVDDLAEVQGEDRGEGEEKKENEPFAVPTAGAFYMHDDRFRDNAGGRPRRTHGGRRLWESQDDRKWGHDKFEELTFQERHYEEGRRNSKGHYRGRGKNQSIDRGYSRGSRSKVNNNQSQAPKSVRGRGPRRFEPTFKNKSQARPTERKQSGKPPEKTSHANSGRAFMPVSNVESGSVTASRRQVFASSLNSASPPFYPSGSSNKDITLLHKRDVQAGSSNRSFPPNIMDDGSSVQQANALRRGKNIAESVGMDKLFIDESINPGAGKPMTNSQIPLSGSSFVSATQYPPTRPPGRGLAIAGQASYQPAAPHNQVNRVSPSKNFHALKRSPAQSRVQPSVQAPAQQASQRPGSGSQASSPPKTGPSISSYEPGEAESPSESNKSKVALVGNGKVNAQSTGRGSVVYSGAQVMGATGSMAVGHGDQNLSGAPAFLPVMQFGGQHPGGIGVPAVGMAFPGYVAQPQLGLGNSEMTWLPVLAGPAGALGAPYCSPYVVDGAYHARPSGQTSSIGASSQENNLNKTNKEWKPSQRPEPGNDEFGQRQNKPRRYSEMSFGQ